MTTTRFQMAAVLRLLVFPAGTMLGQVATPDAGLTYKGLIPVPSWTTSGSTAESVDLSSFNPVTQVLLLRRSRGPCRACD